LWPTGQQRVGHRGGLAHRHTRRWASWNSKIVGLIQSEFYGAMALPQLEEEMARPQTDQPTVGYFHRQVGTTGCEILNPTGQVVAWRVDEEWAARIVRLLTEDNDADED
jgi:hypothetical protein